MEENIGPHPLLWNIDHVCSATGLGRSKIYELTATGEIPSVKVGRRRLFRPADIEAWVASLPDGSDSDS